MRRIVIAALAATAMLGAAPAFAKGCIRGAAAGAVAGHMVGRGHAVLGAAGGCIAMHHHYAKQARAARAAR